MSGIKTAVVTGLGAVLLTLGAAGVVPAAGANERAAATAGNGDIAFQTNRDGGPGSSGTQVYVMTSTGEEEANLSADTTQIDGHPQWSPDGTRIAFERRDPADGSFEVWAMDADGSDQVNLTGDRDAATPDWSPDGTKIVYAAKDPDSADQEIFVMDADGTDPVQLTENAAGDFDPTWSPDGAQIAFRSNRDGNEEIYLMDADGTDQLNLTNNSAEDRDPAWSPDSTRVLFTTNRPVNGASQGFFIHVMLRTGGTASAMIKGIEPEWSPNGEEIVFSRFDLPPGQVSGQGNFDVFKVHLGTGVQTRLTESLAADFAPAWQPVGAPPGADVSVALSDSADPVSLGSGFAYRNVIRNAGPATATGTALSLRLPANVVVTSVTTSQGTCSHNSTEVVCAVGSLGAGTTATVRVAITPSSAGTLEATATVDANEQDPVTANNADAETTTVRAGCTITGTDGPDTLTGTKAADVICGLGGDDVIRGGNGDDMLEGGGGADQLVGNIGADSIRGGAGADTLDAVDGAATDRLDGGKDADTCTADPGDAVSNCP